MQWKRALKNILTTIIVILVTIIVFLVGSTFTQQNIAWYLNLNKPFCQPPPWMFYWIWIILFLLIAVSVIIVLNQRTQQQKKCKIIIPLYFINAILNALYSVFFFGFRNILLAFLDLPFLIASVLLMIWCSHKINKTAAYLLIPYLIWIVFATVSTGIVLYIN